MRCEPDCGVHRARRRWRLAAASVALLLPLPAAAATRAVAESAPVAATARSAIAVRTPPDGGWPAAAEAIAFELDQAGYRVVPTGVEAGATLTVSRDAGGWTIVLLDATRSLVLEATGRDGESPQMVGLHAVELLHASRLDVPKQRRQQPAPVVARPRPATPHPEAPAPATRHAWAADVGVGVSSLGLVGPRLGVAHHWRRAELGAALEAGFGNAGNVDYPTSRDDWWLGRPRAVLRSTVALSYVTRPGRRLRPLLGVASDLVAPIVASTHQTREPALVIDTVEVGAFWAPGIDVGARVVLGPQLAVRAALRAGPLVTLRPVDVASGGTLRLPRGIATATLSFLFGRTDAR
ncbi:MAG: hypothetical protein AAF721_29200 [Myxococcota bacterium]